MEDTYPAELVCLREAIRQQQAQQDIRRALLSAGASPYNSELEKFFDLLRREAEPRGIQGGGPLLSEQTDVDALRRLKAQLGARGGGHGG